MLLGVENEFENFYFKEDILKESKKLPNKIKISLERAKLIENEWNDENKLSFLIYDCLSIENSINIINSLNANIKKSNNQINLKISFNQEEENSINKYLNILKNLVQILNYGNNFKFKKCPLNLEDRIYEISNEEENIITKIGKKKKIISAICEN